MKISILKFLYIFFFYLLFYLNTVAFQFGRIAKITKENGLSHNSITSVIQDNKGFIWLGTYGGLHKYDGKKVTIYSNDPNDSSSISNNAIKILFEDSDNNLWIGTYNGGLSKYIRSLDKFVNYSNHFDPNKDKNLENILSISEDSTGNLWLGTVGGLCEFDPKLGKYIGYYYDFVDNPEVLVTREVFATFIDKKNRLWVGIRNKFGEFDIKSKLYTNAFSIPSFDVFKITSDNNNNLWLGSINDGVIRYSLDDNSIEHFKKSNPINSLNDNQINSLFFNEDKLWIGTVNSGITIYDLSNNNFNYLRSYQSSDYSLSSNTIYSFFKDRSNILWIGTEYGTNKINLGRKKFNRLVVKKPDYYKNENLIVSSIKSVGDNSFWIASMGYGVFKIDSEGNVLTQLSAEQNMSNSLSSNLIRNILIDDNLIWIGTDGAGLNIYDRVTKKVYRYSENEIENNIPALVITYLYKDKLNNIWIGSWHGGALKCKLSSSMKLSYEQFTYNPNSNISLSHTTITKITEDSEGNIWIGTKGGGLNKIVFDKVRDRTEIKSFMYNPHNKNSIPSNEVMEIYEDKNHKLWIGTNNAGFALFDEKSEKFIKYDLKDGLASNTILGILEDNSSKFWLTTPLGLSKFDSETKEIINYNIYDGLYNSSMFENSYYKAEDGELMFGGEKGIDRFYPNQIDNNSIEPEVEITEIQIFNNPVKIGQKINGNVILEQSISQTKEITLTYKESVFTIAFAALHYAAPVNNKFMYRLIGFDKDWRYSDASRQFETYTNLNYGTYRFEVKASNNDGVWSKETASLVINITPPLWETWWAYLIYIGILLGVIISYIKLKTDRQKKELDLLRTADKLKSEFLAQMSHEIRTPINTILSFSNLIKDELQDHIDDELNEGFTGIQSAGRRLIRTIDLILNMSDIQLGTHEYLPREVDIYEDIIKPLEIEHRIPIKDKKLKLDVQILTENRLVKIDTYSVNQIFANLIDNAIKYTEKGKISIEITRDAKDRLAVDVSDTGVGIAKEYLPKLFDEFSQEDMGYTRKFEGNGLGLALVKKYCELNNAKILVDTEKGKGSKFTVIFRN